MAKRPLSETCLAIREQAIQTLKKWDYDPEVYREVEALVAPGLKPRALRLHVSITRPRASPTVQCWLRAASTEVSPFSGARNCFGRSFSRIATVSAPALLA